MKRIAGIAAAAGAAAVLMGNGAGAQGSRVSQSGVLVNVGSRLCAEVQYQSSQDGVNVAQGDCRGGRAEWEIVDLGNGEVAVRNRATGKVLDVSGASRDDGANVAQYTWSGGANQRWRVDGGRAFRLVSVHSGKCLDVEKGSRDSGANILQWSCHGQQNQQWTFERSGYAGAGGSQIGDRGFGRPGDAPIGAPGLGQRPQGRTLYSGMIHSRATNKCADVSNASTDDGADVRQWSCHGKDNQLFDVVDLGRNEVAFIAQNSGKAMEVAGDNRRSGADVVQNRWTGGANQRWRFEPWEQGYSRIVSVGSGKCLDVEAGRFNDGANIIQADCHGGQNQQWRVEVRGRGNAWSNYNPRDNWGRNTFEEPPFYMVGDFRGSSGNYGSNVELSIYSDGVVIAKIDGGQRISGYYRDNHIILGNYRYTVEQDRAGLRLREPGQGGQGVLYTRARYESPRGGRFN
ncbi:MAG: RICIN domain-containing protein [Betaproteobacteria bacterium]|nr:RICIN domain-containing protein [Betaproteobacteria bacterium]